MNGFEIQCLPGAEHPLVVPPQASGYRSTDDWFFDYMTGGVRSDSGETVNPVTALGHGPVWQAINILAGDVGQLPWHKMRKLANGGAERDPNHPVEWLISEQPNGWQAPSVWREMMMGWALGWGNGICGLIRNSAGEREFLPFLPDRTSYVPDDEFGYLITTRIGERKVAASPDEVFHIRGLTSNGFWGLSAVSVCKNVIGHGMSILKHGNSTFKNSARPSGVLSHPQSLTNEARANLRNEWNAIHSGSLNAGQIAILMEGMTWTPTGMSNEDAQWLESRDMDREFIAGLFGLPGFKLGAMKNSAVRANLEEQNRDYFNTSLSRWLNRFNEEAKRKLLSMRERRSREHFFRWYPEAFLRGDIQKRYAAYSQAITARIMNPNEVREKEDMNPYEGGDEFLNPAIDTARGGEDDPPEEKTDDETAKQLAASLVRSQVAALLETEANIVQKSAETARNYVKWAGNYYESFAKTAENFLDLPCKVAVASGYSAADWRTAACGHARSSLNRLLAMAGVADRAAIAEVGKEMAVAIREQTDQFTAAILWGREDG